MIFDRAMRTPHSIGMDQRTRVPALVIPRLASKMADLVCVVLGVGVTFTLEFNMDDLVEVFPEKFMMKTKETFDPREVALYPAKQNGKWLSARDVAALKRGSIPDVVKAIATPSNQLNPSSPVVKTVFGGEFATIHRERDLHVLVDVPGYIKDHLRIRYPGQIIYRKWLYYHRLLFHLGCISWLFGVVAIGLGMYLYGNEENLLGGVIAGCNPANGKLLTVGIPGVVMWLSALASVVLELAKFRVQRKRDKHEEHLKYGTFQTIHGLVV